jgi:hypothetical protein
LTAKKKNVLKQEIVPEATPKYEARIKMFGHVFTATGSTVYEALSMLKFPGTPKAVTSVLSVWTNGKEKSRVLMPKQTFRLFNPSPMMREIGLKQISLLF